MAYQYPFINASEQLKLNVWEKGKVIPDFNASIWRKDKFGNEMKYSEHSNTTSEYGWEIDHIYPEALGGSDLLTNLQPLNWKNNRTKGNSIT